MRPYRSSRRCFLRRMRDLSLLAAVAACTTTPAAQSATVLAAVAAIQAIVVDVQAAVAGGNLTAAQTTDAANQIAALNAQVVALNNAQTTPSAAVTTVTNILIEIGAYLPLILQVIALAAPRAGEKDTPVQSSLRLHLAQLRASAG